MAAEEESRESMNKSIYKNGRHGLPDYSHTPNRIYIKLSHDNTSAILESPENKAF